MRIKITKDQIKGEWMKVLFKQKNTEESSILFCDQIDYIHNKKGNFFDHHLMFYQKNKLIFKVWLKNRPKDKSYKNIMEALKAVGLGVRE